MVRIATLGSNSTARTPYLATESGAIGRSARLAESEIDTSLAQQRVRGGFQGQHAVVAQAVLAAPGHHVAVVQRHPGGLVGALVAAEQENRRHPEGDRDDGGAEIALVPVLVQRQA